MAQNINLIYYVYLNDAANWKAIVSGQLLQVKDYKLFDYAKIYIHITDCYNLEADARALINEIVPAAIISVNYQNQYEYPALALLYKLAVQEPADIFLYLHTKGMSYNAPSRSTTEAYLLSATFEHWLPNINLFNKHKQVNKIGLFPAIWLETKARLGGVGGWVFYNFWYVRGDYVTRLGEPLLHDSRYYYESWLGRVNGQEPFITNDCKSLYHVPFIKKNYFTGSEADFFIRWELSNKSKVIRRLIGTPGSRLLAFIYYKTTRMVNPVQRLKY